MLKRFLLILLLVVLFSLTLVISYRLAAPEIVVVNRSGQVIDEGVVQLPTNRIVFDRIAADENVSIYYTWTQTDGSYQYSVKIDNDIISDHCGYITNHEIGKRLTLIINKESQVTCEESHKL